jgi:thiol-disulfide isomerase/thioredoxin
MASFSIDTAIPIFQEHFMRFDIWLWMAALLSCSFLQEVIAQTPEKDGTAPKESSEAAPDKEKESEKEKDRFEIPSGGVKELLDFISELRGTQPRSQREFTRLQMAITGAAEKILELEKDQTSPAYKTAKIIMLSRQMRGLISQTPEERIPVIKEVESLLEEQPFTHEQIQLGMQAARYLEYSDELKAAIRINEKLGNALKKSDDPEMVERSQMFLGAAKRLGLLGNTMNLRGETVDGKPFRLEQLSNKVVLVDFWATWCGPCIAEIPTMKKMYAGYHDKGFEIVGISLDSERDALVEFIEEKKLPWTILHDKEHDGEHPAAKEYGVSGIPCMILIGRDGKVVSIEARGEKLEELLEKEFGPLPEEKPEEKSSTEEKTSAEK